MNSLLVGKITELPIRVNAAGRSLQLIKVLRQMPGRREVWRAESEDGPLLLKCFAADAAGRRDYRREVAGFSGWEERDIPAPVMLFCHEADTLVLAAQWLEGESVLETYRKTRVWQQKMTLCAGLLSFVARQLAAGCEQTDIHLGNFQRVEGNFALLDAGACRFYQGAVPEKRAQTNLAGLLAQFRVDIARAVIALRPELRVLVDWPALRAEHLEITRNRHARAAAKSLRNCTEFAALKGAQLSGMARRSDWALIESLVHSGLDEVIESGTPLKLGGSATVARVSVQGRSLVIKRYNTKSAGHRIKKMVTRSRAKKSWLNAVWLRSAEIATPLPIAFLEQRSIASEGLAYFITEPADGPDLLAVSEAFLLKAGVAKLLAALVTSMRLLGFSHGDFKGTNLLLQHDELVVIDLDAMQRDLFDVRADKLIDDDVARLCRNWEDGAFKTELLQALTASQREALD